MAFDLASVLKDAAGSSAVNAKEMIEYIPIDRIDPDPMNFYALDGLDALAENIELLGLQQPIRVRAGEGGHVTVVSGHRRRAAILMIIDGGSDMFKDGVPCIREVREGSAALAELRLIYANSATRVMTPSEISRQAERVTELLYKLKEEGIEFPGRMREHVAQACSISQTKLARLHAIRENLHEGLLKHFDSADISESTAYELQRIPRELQQAICEREEKKAKPFIRLYADSVKKCVQNIGYFENPQLCPYDHSSPCENITEIFCRTATTEYWNDCTSRCCCTCHMMETCSSRCRFAAEQREENKKKQAADKLKAKNLQEKRELKNQKAIQEEAKRLVPLIEAAKIGNNDTMPGMIRTAGDILKLAEGDFSSMSTRFQDSILPHFYDQMKQLCDGLNCSLDMIYRPEAVSESDTQTDEAKAVSESDTQTSAAKAVSESDTFAAPPKWQTGEPPFDGPYLCKVSMGGDPYPRSFRLIREAGKWMIPGAFDEIDESTDVTGWWPVPED